MFDRRSGFGSDGREKRKEDVVLPEMGAWRAVILLYTTIVVEAQKIKKKSMRSMMSLSFLLWERASCSSPSSLLAAVARLLPRPLSLHLSDNVITTRMEYNKKKLPVCTLEY